MEYLSFKIR